MTLEFPWPTWRSRWERSLFIALLAGGLLVRIAACLQSPRNSGDLGRQVLTGVMLNAEGWRSAARPVADWAPALAERISWGHVPGNYPPLALAFFQLAAWVHPSLFAAKLLLTLIEAANTMLVFRLTGDRLAAAVHWSLPLSVWWVSHEGAFEPLQNTFVLLALLACRDRPALAPGLLLLAIQVKLSALFLTPWVAWTAFRDPTTRSRAAAGAAVALLPTGFAFLVYPVFAQTGRSLAWETQFNVYHWRAAFDSSYHWWVPGSFVAWVQAASLGGLAWIGWRGARAPAQALPWLGALLFLLAAKFMGVFQHWYFLAFVPLWLPAVPARERLVWFALTQLCEPLSVWQLFFGPNGPVSPHGGFGLFERLG